MNKTVLYILLGLVVILGGWYLLSNYLVGKLDGTGQVGAVDTYNSTELGISFDYPQKYEVVLRTEGNAEREWHTLTLLPDNYEPPVGGEGPPVISVSRFDNSEGLSLERWLISDARSNFKLSADQILTEGTVSSVPSFEYNYSGLYENDAVALERGRSIYLFTVSYLTPQDEIRAEFQDMMSTVHFIE